MAEGISVLMRSEMIFGGSHFLLDYRYPALPKSRLIVAHYEPDRSTYARKFTEEIEGFLEAPV